MRVGWGEPSRGRNLSTEGRPGKSEVTTNIRLTRSSIGIYSEITNGMLSELVWRCDVRPQRGRTLPEAGWVALANKFTSSLNSGAVAHQDEGVTAAELAGVGVQFALAIVLFLFVGQWLDRRLGTAPVFLILGVFAGAGGGFYSMYRKLTAAQRQDGSGRQDGQGR